VPPKKFDFLKKTAKIGLFLRISLYNMVTFPYD